MELPEHALHGFRTIFRKIGRLSREDKAKLYHLLEPNPVMIFGDKAAYDALPEEAKKEFDAYTIDSWHIGMEQVLILMEMLVADGTVKIVQDHGEAGPGSHDRSHFQETAGIHPPDEQ